MALPKHINEHGRLAVSRFDRVKHAEHKAQPHGEFNRVSMHVTIKKEPRCPTYSRVYS